MRGGTHGVRVDKGAGAEQDVDAKRGEAPLEIAGDPGRELARVLRDALALVRHRADLQTVCVSQCKTSDGDGCRTQCLRGDGKLLLQITPPEVG